MTSINSNLRSFITMTPEDKADFFAKCQEILLQKSPNSDYVLTEENLQDNLKIFKKYIDTYKGFCYQSDSSCLLFNYVKIPDDPDINELGRALLYKYPADDYNAISIDFLTSSDTKECVKLYMSQITPQMRYIIYLRNDGIKVFPLSHSKQTLKNIRSMFKL